MNCEDFNKISHELADYQPMEATIREAALSHLALCADCAANLATTRTISNGLVLATGMEIEEAPAAIKTNLLRAFAQSHQTKATAATVVNIAERRKLHWRISAAAAVAAAILLAIMLPLWLRRSSTVEQPLAGTSPGATTKAKDAELVSAVPNKKPDESIQVQPSRVKPVLAARTVMPRVKAATAANTKHDLGTSTVANNSEFVPLTYLAKETAMDSGTIVRVELSRSALARLGLPVTNQDTTASIKAEVIVGDDGVARAIRLVQ